MKKLLREFLGKVLMEVSFDSNVGGGKFPAKIRDSMYGEVGRVVYFKSDDARRKAISNGTHEYVRAEDNPFAGGYDPYAPEAPTSQAPTKDDEEGEAEPFMPAELPAPSPEELAKPTPTEVGNDILSKISQELDQEAAELSDGKMSEVADGYADRDVPEGMSDAEYYAKNPSVLARRFVVPPEIRARLRAANVPERYIKFLERVINSKATVPPSDMAAISGQGTNASRFGEAFTMVLLALPRELRADFTKTISAAVEEGGKKTAPTAEWVASSVGHVHAFEFSMDDKFGEGNWTFDGVAWDSALDIEGLGLARKDKGNSTDIIARVRTPDGNAMAQRLSLKKDEGTQFLSLALNTLRTTLLQFLPNRKQAQRAVRLLNILEELSQKDSSPEEKEVKENMRMSIRRSVQRDDENKPPPWPEARRRVEAQIDELTVEAARHAPAKLVESFRLLDRLADDQNDRNTQVLAGAIDELSPEEYDSIFGPKGTAGPDEKIAAECIKANGKDTQKVLACLSSKKIPGRNYSEALHNATRRIGDSYEKNKNREGQARIQEQLQTVYDLAENISNLYIESLLDSSKPEVLRGLLESMAQSFSIRTCMMGKQEVLIDGFVLNQKVLQQVFGLEDVDNLEEQLRIVTIGNQKVLVYEMKGTGEYIRIGFVRSRQKEKGRKAAVTVFVECSREFALSAAEAGANIARERGEASSLGYTYSPATGAPSQKGKVWMKVGETWTMVPDPLAAKNPTTGATARQGMVWVSTPRIQDGKITGYDWEEIERTPQIEAVMRMRADAKLSEITFEQRPMKSLLVEYLRKILNEQGLLDTKLKYTDSRGKEKEVLARTVQKKGDSHPAWPQLQQLLRTQPIRGAQQQKPRPRRATSNAPEFKPFGKKTKEAFEQGVSVLRNRQFKPKKLQSKVNKFLKHLDEFVNATTEADRKKAMLRIMKSGFVEISKNYNKIYAAPNLPGVFYKIFGGALISKTMAETVRDDVALRALATFREPGRDSALNDATGKLSEELFAVRVSGRETSDRLKELKKQYISLGGDYDKLFNATVAAAKRLREQLGIPDDVSVTAEAVGHLVNTSAAGETADESRRRRLNPTDVTVTFIPRGQTEPVTIPLSLKVHQNVLVLSLRGLGIFSAGSTMFGELGNELDEFANEAAVQLREDLANANLTDEQKADAKRKFASEYMGKFANMLGDLQDTPEGQARLVELWRILVGCDVPGLITVAMPSYGVVTPPELYTHDELCITEGVTVSFDDGLLRVILDNEDVTHKLAFHVKIEEAGSIKLQTTLDRKPKKSTARN